MNTSTLNLYRSFAGLVAACVLAGLAAPMLIESREWAHVGPVAVSAMLVFCIYTVAYLAIGLSYIVRKKGYDRHIFPEGLHLEGRTAVRLGLKYLILSSIAAFGATLIYAVILRGLRYAHLM